MHLHNVESLRRRRIALLSLYSCYGRPNCVNVYSASTASAGCLLGFLRLSSALCCSVQVNDAAYTCCTFWTCCSTYAHRVFQGRCLCRFICVSEVQCQLCPERFTSLWHFRGRNFDFKVTSLITVDVQFPATITHFSKNHVFGWHRCCFSGCRPRGRRCRG